jgi:hypothetical protein
MNIKKDVAGKKMGTVSGKFSTDVSECQVRDIVRDFLFHCAEDHASSQSSFCFTTAEHELLSEAA